MHIHALLAFQRSCSPTCVGIPSLTCPCASDRLPSPASYNIWRWCVGAGSGYKGHVESLAPAVKQLAALEKRAQSSYLNLIYNKPFITRRWDN